MPAHAPLSENALHPAGPESFLSDDELVDDLIAAASADFPARNELSNARARVLARMKGALRPEKPAQEANP